MSLMLAAPVSLMAAADRGLRLRFRHLLRKVGTDDLDLAPLLVGKLLAAGFVVDLDRFLALLDQLLQEAEQILVRKRAFLGCFRLDIAFLMAALTRRRVETWRSSRAFIGGLQGGVDLIAQHGYGLS